MESFQNSRKVGWKRCKENSENTKSGLMTLNILQRYYFTIINLSITQIFYRLKKYIVKRELKFYEIKNFKPTLEKSINKIYNDHEYKKIFLPPYNFYLLNEQEKILSFLIN